MVIFRPLLSNFMQNVGNSQDNYLAKSGRTQKKNRRKRPIFLRLIEIFFLRLASIINVVARCGRNDYHQMSVLQGAGDNK